MKGESTFKKTRSLAVTEFDYEFYLKNKATSKLKIKKKISRQFRRKGILIHERY